MQDNKTSGQFLAHTSLEQPSLSQPSAQKSEVHFTALRRIPPQDVPAPGAWAVDPQAAQVASQIIADVRAHGWSALVGHAVRLGDIPDSSAQLIYPRQALAVAAQGLPEDQRALLQRACARIERFAKAQRAALQNIQISLPGDDAVQDSNNGCMGHTVAPVRCAGCYAPGGRFPLPSSVLMTAVTARAAGVSKVWVASPKPTQHTLAAAYIAGADALLACGGAQAIAALACGVGAIPACDVIAGPGNKYVTAAKQQISGQVRIDMLAGPSELAILADPSASPVRVAADLLGQAEHDVDARPMLVLAPGQHGDVQNRSLVACQDFARTVDAQLAQQLSHLPTRTTAQAALAANGFVVLCEDLNQACGVCDTLAPEHLQVMGTQAQTMANKLQHYGALFVGQASAEVFGDYGIGPNHVLPTGGGARHTGGLSVFDFLRVRTFVKADTMCPGVIKDTVALARMEGLAAHAQSAQLRNKV